MEIYLDDSWNKIYLRDENLDALTVVWTTVPTDTASWYAKWCTFVDSDVASGTGWVYLNKGTNLSCVFTLATQAA